MEIETKTKLNTKTLSISWWNNFKFYHDPKLLKHNMDLNTNPNKKDIPTLIWTLGEFYT